jgi:CheY-like chemotaxis protein
MSFKSSESSNLRRRELEGAWRQRFENAFERYCAAAEEYVKLLREGAGQCPRNELHRFMRAEADELEEQSRLLRIFTDLAVDSKLPEEADETISSFAATPVNRISVVDDDESTRDLLETLLRSAGYQVATFASAESFLKSAELLETECLILDIRMPGMDGLELQRRANSTHPDIPIIFLRPHDDLKNRCLATDASTADFLGKPIEADSLVAAVRTALIRRPGTAARWTEACEMSKKGGQYPWQPKRWPQTESCSPRSSRIEA